MAYPPQAHTETAPDKIIDLVRQFPFAHFFTTGVNGHRVTRLPFAADLQGSKIVQLRAHMNKLNPQAEYLDGSEALIAFSGPDSYISPNWRLDTNRAATWDYTAVHIKGVVKIRTERAFFETLITDLSATAEARFSGLANTKDWSISDAPKGYIDRLFPHLVGFEVEVSHVQGISKLHQDFPNEDALSVANHLSKSPYDSSQQVGHLIKKRLGLTVAADDEPT